MAQLIGLKERQLGLAEIEAKLKELSKVREFLEQENPTGVYTLSFDKQRVKLLCPNREDVDRLVKAYQERLASEIKTMATRFDVELDEAEQALLN